MELAAINPWNKLLDGGNLYHRNGTLPIPQTMGERERLIEDILRKNVLCRHDIKSINRVYQGQNLTLQKIIERVQDIVSKPKLHAKDLITLYHLQGFTDKDAHIDESYQTCFSQFEKSPANLEELAIQLPYCGSIAKFEADVTSLFGPVPSEEASKILDRKRDFIQQIERKKAELEELRSLNPQSYPDYLHQLLLHGNVHLYDHLIQMGSLENHITRFSEIGKIHFSLMSHVVLDTKEAIMQRVVGSISADCNSVLVLLGNAGAGKSTALCFLRGDEMVLGEDFNYSSQDESGLIGHELATSCTFLPTVEIVNGQAIIDFPGFEDTNGPLVCLGMECALKALVMKYNPKVLVLEAITNDEGRYHNAAQLGSLLNRLLENKENCVLGITKYSKDPHYREIVRIEEKQINERLSPSVEENELTAVIKALSDLNLDHLEPTIQGKKERLAEIREAREQELQQPLPEAPEKVAHRKQLKDKENELLRQLGLTKVVRFDDLTDPSVLTACFATLSEHTDVVKVNPQLQLDTAHAKLLKHLFESDLLKIIKAKQENPELQKLEVFEQSVLETSLINTIFAGSNPEIGLFFHLPEIDHNIVNEYDRVIVHDFIRSYLDKIIGVLNSAFVDQMLNNKEYQEYSTEFEDLNKSWNRLRNYILGLAGIEISNDPVEAMQNWQKLETVRIGAISERSKLGIGSVATGGVTGLLFGLIVGGPFGGVFFGGSMFLYDWYKKRKDAKERVTVDLLMEHRQALDHILHILQMLKGIEKSIEKRNEINNAFLSVPVSCLSMGNLQASMQKRINAIRKIYGKEEWDKRVLFLSDQWRFRNFDSNNIAHMEFLNACAYGLIDLDLTAHREELISSVFDYIIRKTSISTHSDAAHFIAAYQWAEKMIAENRSTVIATSFKTKEWIRDFAKNLTTSLRSTLVKNAECFELAIAAEWIAKQSSRLADIDSKEFLETMRLLMWTLIRVNSYDNGGLKMARDDFFIFTVKDSEQRSKVEILGLGELPKLFRMIDKLPSRHSPLNCALLAAALLKGRQ